METRVFGLLQTQTDRLLKAITKSNAVNYPVTLLLFFLLFRGGLWEVTSPPMPPALPWTMGRPCNLCTNYTSLGTHWSPPTSERRRRGGDNFGAAAERQIVSHRRASIVVGSAE